jgi:VWFA-related protein
MKRLPAMVLVLLAVLPAAAQTKLLLTVVDKKTGEPVTDLKASEIAVFADKTPRRVEGCEYAAGLIDVMLLLDTSLIGEMVQPFAGDLISQLAPKEQMAIVSFHSSADLIQDFTSSKQLLMRAVEEVKYGNSPHVLDAIYAAANEGFEHSSFRRVVLLLTTGVDAPSRVKEREVVRLCRRNGVSIYPVYMLGYGRSLFEKLAEQTGGAPFNIRELSKNVSGSPAARIFEVVRGRYTLTLSGNLSLGEKVKVEVKRRRKMLVSYLPLE